MKLSDYKRLKRLVKKAVKEEEEKKGDVLTERERKAITKFVVEQLGFSLSEYNKYETKKKEKMRGFAGEKGERGRPPTEEEITSTTKQVIEKLKSQLKGKDGKNGRTPMFVGKNPPKNPQKGDLWYKD